MVDLVRRNCKACSLCLDLQQYVALTTAHRWWWFRKPCLDRENESPLDIRLEVLLILMLSARRQFQCGWGWNGKCNRWLLKLKPQWCLWRDLQLDQLLALWFTLGKNVFIVQQLLQGASFFVQQSFYISGIRISCFPKHVWFVCFFVIVD